MPNENDSGTTSSTESTGFFRLELRNEAGKVIRSEVMENRIVTSGFNTSILFEKPIMVCNNQSLSMRPCSEFDIVPLPYKRPSRLNDIVADAFCVTILAFMAAVTVVLTHCLIANIAANV